VLTRESWLHRLRCYLVLKLGQIAFGLDLFGYLVKNPRCFGAIKVLRELYPERILALRIDSLAAYAGASIRLLPEEIKLDHALHCRPIPHIELDGVLTVPVVPVVPVVLVLVLALSILVALVPMLVAALKMLLHLAQRLSHLPLRCLGTHGPIPP
jgi:hypothetical protein